MELRILLWYAKIITKVIRISVMFMDCKKNFSLSGCTYYHEREELPDKSKLEPHIHEFLELYFIKDGDASFFIEGNEYVLKSGDIVVVRDRENHFLKLNSDEPYERIVLNFSQDYLKQFDSSFLLTDVFYNRELGHNNVFSQERLGINVYKLLLEIEKKEYNENLLELKLKSILAFILIKINSFFDEYFVRKTPVVANDTVALVIKYINENLKSDLNIELICEKFFISKSYLNTLFVKKTGVTVWKYITLKRLTLAKNYIENGMYAVEASNAVGFNDYSSFFRQYKKQFNISPSMEKKTKGE